MSDYKTKYTAYIGEQLAAMTADGTPYDTTMQHLADALDRLELRADQKAQFTMQFLSQVTVAFTNLGITTAMQLAEKDLMMPDQVANLAKQGILLDKQASKLDADKLLVDEQKEAIKQQVIDNRKIKVFASTGETFGNGMIGGLLINPEMWEFYFRLAAGLIDNLKDHKGQWDATTAFTPPSTPIEGDYFGISTAGGTYVDGFGGSTIENEGTPEEETIYYWKAGEIIYYDGHKWKKSLVSLPTDTTMTKAT